MLFRPELKCLKKSPKNRKFSKGVSPWFLSKIDLFLMCVFLGATKGRCLIFWMEKNAF